MIKFLSGTRDHDLEQKIQRQYYARTAPSYDESHCQGSDVHEFSLALLSGLIDLLQIRSILDIGSGTGRAILKLKSQFPGLRIVGVEPSSELRAIGYDKGLGHEELVDGDAQNLSYKTESFDLVCEFATLHHVPKPDKVVEEMLRVSRTGIFISDSNCYGQGSAPERLAKRLLRSANLWPLFNHIRSGGAGYFVSEGDGLFYSYSVFDNLPLIEAACRSVHIMNTYGGGIDPFKSASQVALLGLKDRAIAFG